MRMDQCLLLSNSCFWTHPLLWSLLEIKLPLLALETVFKILGKRGHGLPIKTSLTKVLLWPKTNDSALWQSNLPLQIWFMGHVYFKHLFTGQHKYFSILVLVVLKSNVKYGWYWGAWCKQSNMSSFLVCQLIALFVSNLPLKTF